jgi:hypothetical protein
MLLSGLTAVAHSPESQAVLAQRFRLASQRTCINCRRGSTAEAGLQYEATDERRCLASVVAEQPQSGNWKRRGTTVIQSMSSERQVRSAELTTDGTGYQCPVSAFAVIETPNSKVSR